VQRSFVDVIRILYLAFKKESLLPKQDLKLGPAGLGLVFYVCEKSRINVAIIFFDNLHSFRLYV
jgi:hypothetical protein